MASTYTSRIRLEQQGDGENANTWGQRLNQNVIDLVDEAVAGYESIDVSAASSVTLTANNGTTDQSRNFGLKFTGALNADTTVTVPAQEKIYFVNNQTTGNYNLLIKPAGGTPVTAPGSGKSMIIAGDGVSFDKFTDGSFDSGTRMLFQQATAPVGWTAISASDYNDAGLRIVSPDTYTTAVGGSTAFSTVFASQIVSVAGNTAYATLSGDTSATAITVDQMPAHSHTISTNFVLGLTDTSRTTSPPTADGGAGTLSPQPTWTASNTGGGQGHTHSLAGKGTHFHPLTASGTLNLDVKYVNFIIAQKD